MARQKRGFQIFRLSWAVFLFETSENRNKLGKNRQYHEKRSHNFLAAPGYLFPKNRYFGKKIFKRCSRSAKVGVPKYTIRPPVIGYGTTGFID